MTGNFPGDRREQAKADSRPNEVMASGSNVRILPAIVHIQSAAVLLFPYFDDSDADHNASVLRWSVFSYDRRHERRP